MAAISPAIPDEPLSQEALLAHARKVLFDVATSCGHPRFMGYVCVATSRGHPRFMGCVCGSGTYASEQAHVVIDPGARHARPGEPGGCGGRLLLRQFVGIQQPVGEGPTYQ